MDAQLTDISQQGRIREEIIRNEERVAFGEDACVKNLWDGISLKLAESHRESGKRDLTIKVVCLVSEKLLWARMDAMRFCALMYAIP